MLPWQIWPPSSLPPMTFLNPRKDGLKSPFSLPTPVRVSLATLTPLPKKLSIIVSSRSLLAVSTNLFQKTLSLRSLLSTTASKGCVSTLDTLLLGVLCLLSLSFVSPLADSSTVPHPIGSPGQPSSSSPLALVPLLPNHALPYAIYFCPSQAVRSSFVMASAPDVNHPAPLPPPSSFSLPLLRILFLLPVGTPSVVPRTLVSSLMSIKCSRTTSPSLCTPLITVMALTLSLSLLNTSFPPSLSLPSACNKPGLPPDPLWLLLTRLALSMFLLQRALLKPFVPPLPMHVYKLPSLARSQTTG